MKRERGRRGKRTGGRGLLNGGRRGGSRSPSNQGPQCPLHTGIRQQSHERFTVTGKSLRKRSERFPRNNPDSLCRVLKRPCYPLCDRVPLAPQVFTAPLLKKCSQIIHAARASVFLLQPPNTLNNIRHCTLKLAVCDNAQECLLRHALNHPHSLRL